MDVTDATFQTDVLDSQRTVPVVVDLWAPWCGPCTTLGPMLERAVAATEGAVELAKVNVDENPSIAQTFGVQSIPAVFAIPGRQGGGPLHRRATRGRGPRIHQPAGAGPERGRPLGGGGRRDLTAAGPSSSSRITWRRPKRWPGCCLTAVMRPTPWPSWPAIPETADQPGPGRRGPPA